VIDHIGFEVTELERSARFYDAVFYALGSRRMIETEHAVAYGINVPVVWFVVRGRTPGPGYGHLALQASGKAAVDAAHRSGLANGGTDDGAPGQRPAYGRRYYSGYLLDPDGLRVEIVSRR
jgi:catechol 2,3-dioxygenase-like lactoylglutathione lyase family enzyme